MALPLSFGCTASTACSSFSLIGGLRGGMPNACLVSGKLDGRTPKSKVPIAATVGDGLAALILGMLALPAIWCRTSHLSAG